MNSDDKLKELGERLEISEEELTVMKKPRWYKVNPIVYVILGVVAILTYFQGYNIGKDAGTYPFRIFFGPFVITTEKANIKLRIIGVVMVAAFLAIICSLIGLTIGFGDAPSSEPRTEIIHGTTYTIAARYGVWSLEE